MSLLKKIGGTVGRRKKDRPQIPIDDRVPKPHRRPSGETPPAQQPAKGASAHATGTHATTNAATSKPHHAATNSKTTSSTHIHEHLRRNKTHSDDKSRHPQPVRPTHDTRTAEAAKRATAPAASPTGAAAAAAGGGGGGADKPSSPTSPTSGSSKKHRTSVTRYSYNELSAEERTAIDRLPMSEKDKSLTISKSGRHKVKDPRRSIIGNGVYTPESPTSGSNFGPQQWTVSQTSAAV